MPAPQNFLDNLENLQIVTSTALEHVQDNRDHFAKSATGGQVRQVHAGGVGGYAGIVSGTSG